MVDTAVLFLFDRGNLGLAYHPGPVLKDRLQLYVGAGYWNYLACNCQYMAHLGNGLFKGTCHPMKRGQKQVAKGLPRQGTVGKAIGQQLFHHWFSAYLP